MTSEPVAGRSREPFNCPFLRRADGEAAGVCLAVGSPLTIEPDYAASYCTTPNHVACGLYADAVREQNSVAPSSGQARVSTGSGATAPPGRGPQDEAPFAMTPARLRKAPAALGQLRGTSRTRTLALIALPLLLLGALLLLASQLRGNRGAAVPGALPTSTEGRAADARTATLPSPPATASATAAPPEATARPTNTKRPPVARLRAYYAASPTGNGLNLRERPNKSSELLTTVPVGGRVRAQGPAVTGADRNRWRKVTYNGRTGYVLNRYLFRTKQAALENSKR